jgi:two-component system, cell cycle sensor histidine kinase and response regulator CckA
MHPDYEQMSRADMVAELKSLHSAIPLIVFDASGAVTNVTGAAIEMLGCDRRDIVGVDFSRFVAESDIARFAEHLKSVRESGKPHAAEIVLNASSGATHVRIDSAPANGEYQSEGAVRSVVCDVSERKQLEEQLLVTQRLEAMGRLAGGIAHDFNNILMAMLGQSEVLLLRLGTSDPMRDSVESIQKTIERAAMLTRQLIAFSRKQVIAPKVLAINSVIAGMDGILRRVISEDIDLVYILRSDVAPIRVDPAQIEQVIMNLVVNGRDAMLRGGRLTIETRNMTLDQSYAARHVNVTPGDYVRIAISDTGEGIDPETQKRIFEPFFTTKAHGKGSGLGLATVYGIVEQSGGHIVVSSTVGTGTTFEIYLPRVEDVAPAEIKKPRVEAPRGTETILVIEDEDSVREPVCDMLRLSGYTVLEARHGGEALLICERHKGTIDLMLSDVVMPQISGRELAQRVAPLRPEMRVLFMSGHTEDAVLRYGVMNATMAFVQKPFTLEALGRKLRAVLDGNTQ